MLTEFGIGNYQAFKTLQRVPLKPITLVFGPNSAGKSALLRSLLVARHAMLNGMLSKNAEAHERHPGEFKNILRGGEHGTGSLLFEFTIGDKHSNQKLSFEWKEPLQPTEGAGADAVCQCLKQIEYHGPQRPVPDKITLDDKGKHGFNSWWNLASSPRLLKRFNDWLQSEAFANKYRLVFDRYYPQSSLERLEARLNRENSVQDLVEYGFMGKLDGDADFRRKLAEEEAEPFADAFLSSEDFADEQSRIQAAVEQLEGGVLEDEAFRLGPRYYEDLESEDIEGFFVGALNRAFREVSGEVNRVHSDLSLSRHFTQADVFFEDSKSKARVPTSNIGFGISQMLPLAVSAFATKDRLIVIEQPELHVHPALQCELGDIFICSAMEQGNRYLIETHSEHLILRIMRRMRETFENKLPEGMPRLTPDDVSILYVEPGEDGSIVREMPLNERGELVKGWPGGFFEEALNEM
jgi:AAA15 family ATPase/GTPase